MKNPRHTKLLSKFASQSSEGSNIIKSMALYSLAMNWSNYKNPHCLQLHVPDQQRHTQKAKKYICKCATISGELRCRNYYQLYALFTPCAKRKPLPALLSTESSSGSEEGQQMMLELLNKAFSAKATCCKSGKCQRER